MIEEQNRLIENEERRAYWSRWGPYLSERQWGTVREDYSPYGTAWEYFPHDQARSRAYRWGEDGLCGISDNHQRLCFALAFWNGRDSILKERLFGLGNPEGNHGEDVKEYYFYLDSTPTHSYMKCLYKYPQAAFPYQLLVEENRRRGRSSPEYELLDTGVFDGDRYFDIIMEYAKVAVDDLLVRVTAINRGSEAAELHLLPTLWFRNTWSWDKGTSRPQLQAISSAPGSMVIAARHQTLGARWLHAEDAPELLFTENETNFSRLFRVPGSPYVKDSIHERVVAGKEHAVNPARVGTKAAAWYRASVPAGGQIALRLRLTDADPARTGPAFGLDFEETFSRRIREADEFYDLVIPRTLSADARLVMRQALAGMLWTRQFYHYDVKRWLAGDPTQPPPPPERRWGRNREWTHLYNEDVISMPDKWEYPWYASWDLAFHMIPMALVDPEFAKAQLVLFLREWYMHPNGQIPAYEWSFSDVNPPVHAWAAWRVYKIDRRIRGVADREFLERVFHKLLLNFTWWVNRKDPAGRNVFQGGFLGLDNIGVFDRSAPLPTGGYIEQSDGTSWMGMYCLNMLAMALELARDDRAYEDVASKFFEHFVYIAHATHHLGGDSMGLWDEEDGFFYDVLNLPDGTRCPMKVRSLVGLIPLFAVETWDTELADRLPGFNRRAQWFIDNNPELREHIAFKDKPGGGRRVMLSIVSTEQLPRVLRLMLDEEEFLSPYGIRSLSRFHKERPYVLRVSHREYRVDYEPAESTTGLFGGNSNWRGPVWFPVNFLLVESLQKYHHFFGDDLKVACPTRSGRLMSLWDVAADVSRRLNRLFLAGPDGRRPIFGGTEKFQRDPHWRGLPLFYEYFHGDSGAGLGASHQTGWTGVVAKLLWQSGE
jgi:mannosylglycerate hydrolase MGH1-like protein/glycosyl hydrolase family 63